MPRRGAPRLESGTWVDDDVNEQGEGQGERAAAAKNEADNLIKHYEVQPPSSPIPFASDFGREPLIYL